MRPLEPGQTYAGRRVTAGVLTLTMDREALEILYRYSPKEQRSTGAFLSRLIYEFDARQDERRRLREEVSAVLG